MKRLSIGPVGRSASALQGGPARPTGRKMATELTAFIERRTLGTRGGVPTNEHYHKCGFFSSWSFDLLNVGGCVSEGR